MRKALIPAILKDKKKRAGIWQISFNTSSETYNLIQHSIQDFNRESSIKSTIHFHPTKLKGERNNP